MSIYCVKEAAAKSEKFRKIPKSSKTPTTMIKETCSIFF